MGPPGASVRVLVGYLAGIALGTMSVTLHFLGMRAVMDVGGACAHGGPYVSAQPCPTGVPLALVGGMFGLFGGSGLIVWFGSRIGQSAATIVALGWPAMVLALGFNFLDDSFRPPDVEPTPVWGWLIPGALFWAIGAAPVAVGIAAWREVGLAGPGTDDRSRCAGARGRRRSCTGWRRPLLMRQLHLLRRPNRPIRPSSSRSRKAAEG